MVAFGSYLERRTPPGPKLFAGNCSLTLQAQFWNLGDLVVKHLQLWSHFVRGCARALYSEEDLKKQTNKKTPAAAVAATQKLACRPAKMKSKVAPSRPGYSHWRTGPSYPTVTARHPGGPSSPPRLEVTATSLQIALLHIWSVFFCFLKCVHTTELSRKKLASFKSCNSKVFAYV